MDNNIFAGRLVRVTSEGVVLAHNLLVNCPLFVRNGSKAVAFWEPHTGKRLGTPPIPQAHVKWWNNLFATQGADSFVQGQGNASDWNVFYGGAKKTTWDDAHSRVETLDPAANFNDLPDGVEITFRAGSAPCKLGGPLITPEFVGEFALTQQRLEDADGNPIVVERDLVGAPRAKTCPVAGPLESLRDGVNVLRVRAGAPTAIPAQRLPAR